jgi:hypothetical protein
MSGHPDYPIVYEYRDGSEVHPEWAGQQVPVPPEWVRQRTGLTRGCELACLSPELKDRFSPEIRKGLVAYVRDYERVRRDGANLLVCGSGASFRLRQWAAAATLNEIVMRWSSRYDLSASWLSMRTLRYALDAKLERAETYFQMRNRFFSSKLLLVEEPLRAPAGSEERRFLEYVYEHRYNAKLPTITTLSTDLVDADFTIVKALLGPYITEVLEASHYGYIVNFPTK